MKYFNNITEPYSGCAVRWTHLLVHLLSSLSESDRQTLKNFLRGKEAEWVDQTSKSEGFHSNSKRTRGKRDRTMEVVAMLFDTMAKHKSYATVNV